MTAVVMARVPSTTSLDLFAKHANHVQNWATKHIVEELTKLEGASIRIVGMVARRAPRGGQWVYLEVEKGLEVDGKLVYRPLQGTSKIIRKKDGKKTVKFKRGNITREGEVWLCRAGFRWSRHQRRWVHPAAGEIQPGTGERLVKYQETEEVRITSPDGTWHPEVVNTIFSEAWLRMVESDDPNDFGTWGPVGWVPDPGHKGRYVPATITGAPMKSTRAKTALPSASPKTAIATGAVEPPKKKASKWKALAAEEDKKEA